MFKKLLPILFLFTGFQANAVLISADDWHLTTDSFGGLKQSNKSDDVFFAVAKAGVWSDSNTYSDIEGYHIATTQEYIDLTNINDGSYDPNDGHVYFNKGGWSGYTWAQANRYVFLFSDSLDTLKNFHAGGLESKTYFDANYNGYRNLNKFAGFIVVADSDIPDLSPKTSNVPEPSILALMGLGIFGIGFARRRQS
jgi:hypothetical protein